jgi:hypothetical protein
VIRLSGLTGDFQHAAGGLVQGHDLAEVVAAPGLFHVVAHAHAQSQHFTGAMQGGNHVSQVEWLDEVIVGSQFHGLHGAVHHVVGAHHQDDGRGVGSLHAAQHFHAVDAGKNDIEQG